MVWSDLGCAVGSGAMDIAVSICVINEAVLDGVDTFSCADTVLIQINSKKRHIVRGKNPFINSLNNNALLIPYTQQ